MKKWLKWFSSTPLRMGLLTATGVLTGVLIAALIANITGRIFEKANPPKPVVELSDETYDPAEWGKNFPLHYESYMSTADMQRTRYGGSESMPHVPDNADPRSVVTQSKIDEDPRLKTMWAGYAFSIDFREERGHAYMLMDQKYTQRHQVKQPGTCLNCHASTYPIYKKLGEGDLYAGFHAMNKMTYTDAVKHAEHPVACIDCHNPRDMSLRITRPAFMTAIALVKKDPDYDVNEDASQKEMRTYVCAQCHVEYYFKGEEKTLTYPWANGLRADDILAYYEQIQFKDWTHKKTGAAALKAQHPEFEMYSQGIHARSGVACADCHMPYERTGAAKMTNHHVQSPYLTVEQSCGTCHAIPAEELRQRIDIIQDNHWQLRDTALDALTDLISDIEKAQAAGVSETKLNEARAMQRKSQFLLDFAEAENSTGFHAPQEGARVLGLSINYARKGQNALH